MNEKHDPRNLDCDCSACLRAEREAVSMLGRVVRSPVMVKLREAAKRRRKMPRA